MPLFRPEALRGQDTLHGDVSLVPPVSWQMIGLFLFAAVAVAFVFMATAGYARVTVVKGVVAGDRGVVRITPVRAGVLEQVYVREGQAVKAGTPLARIAVSASTEEGASALSAERRELDRRLTASQQAAAERLAALASQAAGERAQIANLREQVAQERALLRTAEADLEGIQPAVRDGFVARRVLREHEQQVGQHRQTLSRMNQEIAQRQTAIRVAEADMARQRAEAAGQASQIVEARAGLERDAAGQDLQGGAILRAPVDGVVTAVVGYAGEPAAAGAPVMTLAPKGARLEASLYVPPSAAGLIEPDQPVRVAVDAFPYQVFGALDAKVTSVSLTSAPAPGVQGEAFLVRATLPPTISAYGKAQALRPGMTVTARIRTRPRSLLAWIFDPVLAVSRR